MHQESIEIKATPKQCYKIITDYESYPEFLEDLTDVQVVSKKGNVVEVEFHINVVKDISYTLRLEHTPKSNDVEWTFVDGDFMKDNYGHWDLEELKKGLTLATYNIDVKFGLLVPKSVTKMLVDKSLPKTLKAFKKRIESSK